MAFEWDEGKRLRNLAKHGLNFEDAPQIFADNVFVVDDTRYDYAEQRFIAYGLLARRVVVIAFTLRDDDTVRVISMRKANKREQEVYDQQ
jgi:uncharacterized DUF497 family protein